MELVLGTKDLPAQLPLLLFPYPKKTYHPTPPENVFFWGNYTRYHNFHLTKLYCKFYLYICVQIRQT